MFIPKATLGVCLGRTARGKTVSSAFINKWWKEWRGILLYILPNPLPFSSLFPCRLPSPTQAFMQFYWFSIPIPPFAEALVACYANSHGLSTTSCPQLCQLYFSIVRVRVCPDVHVVLSIGCKLPGTVSVIPKLPSPQFPGSLCPMYRMVGSSLPFRKLAANKSAGMTQQKRRLRCVWWKEQLFSQRKIKRTQALKSTVSIQGGYC